jgi:hypothetical protein
MAMSKWKLLLLVAIAIVVGSTNSSSPANANPELRRPLAAGLLFGVVARPDYIAEEAFDETDFLK